MASPIPDQNHFRLSQQWFSLRSNDRTADVHLRLLAEAATEALKSLDYLDLANSRGATRRRNAA